MKRYLLKTTSLFGVPGFGHGARGAGMGQAGAAILRAIWWPHQPFNQRKVIEARVRNGTASAEEQIALATTSAATPT